MHGNSSVIGADPYTLSIYIQEGYTYSGLDTGDTACSVLNEGQIIKMTINSARNTEVEWVVKFKKSYEKY